MCACVCVCGVLHVLQFPPKKRILSGELHPGVYECVHDALQCTGVPVIARQFKEYIRHIVFLSSYQTYNEQCFANREALLADDKGILVVSSYNIYCEK